MEKIDPSTLIERLQSGVACIDSVMGGGLEPGVITEFYGEGGSGKSNLAMVFSLAAIKLGKTAIYLDTEGFSGDRFMQICGSDRTVAENMHLFRVSSLDDQELSLMRASKNLEKMKNPGILVVDSGRKRPYLLYISFLSRLLKVTYIFLLYNPPFFKGPVLQPEWFSIKDVNRLDLVFKHGYCSVKNAREM